MIVNVYYDNVTYYEIDIDQIQQKNDNILFHNYFAFFYQFTSTVPVKAQMYILNYFHDIKRTSSESSSRSELILAPVSVTLLPSPATGWVVPI